MNSELLAWVEGLSDDVKIDLILEQARKDEAYRQDIIARLRASLGKEPRPRQPDQGLATLTGRSGSGR